MPNTIEIKCKCLILFLGKFIIHISLIYTYLSSVIYYQFIYVNIILLTGVLSWKMHMHVLWSFIFSYGCHYSFFQPLSDIPMHGI